MFTFTRSATDVFPALLSHITLQTHPIQRPLVLTGHLLHDGRQEGLRVKQPSQPHGRRQLEVRRPLLQLLDSLLQVREPDGEAVQGRVGALHPRLGDRVQEQ